jgi:hypothetical protein
MGGSAALAARRLTADLPCVTGRFPVRRPSGSGSLAAASASCGVLFSSLVDGLDGSPSTSALLLDAPCKRGALLPPPVLVALPGTGASPVTTVSARKAVRCGRGPKLSSAMQALPSRHAATSLGHRRRRSALGGARVWPFAPGGAMCRAPSCYREQGPAPAPRNTEGNFIGVLHLLLSFAKAPF